MDRNPTNNTNKDPGKVYSPLARLVQLGREKSYVTLEDILKFFPEPEKDMDQTDRIFATLLTAGIPYIDHSNFEEKANKDT
jgi:RNA polymerase primary sigma factor